VAALENLGCRNPQIYNNLGCRNPQIYNAICPDVNDNRRIDLMCLFTLDQLRNNFQSIVILNLFKISERSEVTIYLQQL